MNKWLNASLLVFLAAISFFHSNAIRLYPIVINLMIGYNFARTLWNPPPMIERFARLRHHDLPPEAIPYLRTTTKVWVGFFIVNTSMAILTYFAPWTWWLLYNGLISYIIIGTLIVGEWIIRQWIQKK